MSRVQVLSLEKYKQKVTLSHLAIVIVLFKVLILGYFTYLLISEYSTGNLVFNSTFFLFILAGFFAQIVDGALGMAYGVSCTSLLLGLGVPPKLASASVHTSEIFTTGVSGLSHIKFDNIDKRLFLKIVVTGVLGASLGAYLLSDLLDGSYVKPFISLYLFGLGVYLLTKAFKKKEIKQGSVKRVPILAFFGGLLDAIGGGGWGPIVTTNLLSQGQSPRYTIGTVNTAEFFVTYFATAVFVFVLGVQHLDIVLGLVIGGVIAAPFGAYLASRINQRVLLILVGILVVLTSAWGLINTLLN